LIRYGTDRSAPNPLPELPVNADGTFHLGVPQDKEAVITVKAPGFAPVLKRVTAKQPIKITFDLTEPLLLEGHVVDKDGKPIAGASVFFDTWQDARTLNYRARTQIDGH